MRPRRTTRPARLAAVALAAAVILAGCGGADGDSDASPDAADGSPSQGSTTADDHADEHADGSVDDHADDHAGVKPAKSIPLRKGEKRLTLKMAEPYTPKAPSSVGTDDYRCFILDPDLDKDAFIAGTDVRPGNQAVVHHVILFRIGPDLQPAAEKIDAESPEPGWTCFGNMGITDGPVLENAPWLGAWAPGGKESLMKQGFGVRLGAEDKIVMQVHYNLLAGDDPDVSATRLRLAPANADTEPIETMLLPAPVELPCRPDHDDDPLCDRATAVVDVKARFGQGPGSTADALHLLCASPVKAGKTQSCTRTIGEPSTILGVAGHMHLLGTSIKVEVNPGKPDAQTVLNIKHWDFDNQGAKPVKPVALEPWDEVKVTCRHSQRARDLLPSFQDQPERYVVWGEGTTDEMCLGILQIARP